MNAIATYLERNRERHLAELVELLSIPSISTDSSHAGDVRRAAEWLHRRLDRAGCSLVETIATGGHPIVYGEWSGAPGRPTILVYGHYDVQPVDPLHQWTSPPFEPEVRDGQLYARGAADDKGQMIVHVNALEAHLAVAASAPVNVKFLIEGEEEIGSKHLEPFVRDNRDRLACDAIVVSDTTMFAKGIPSICYGLRGLTYLEIAVRGSDRDLHSGSYGGAVINPANALVGMLARLKDAKGRVTIPGFYDKVRRLSVPERRSFNALPHSDRRFQQAIGAPALFGESGYSTLERVWVRPSLDINGIWAGFTGEGAKTVIPAEAHAKLSMRLVPDQTPKEIARKAMAYLKQLAPAAVKVTVREVHGGDAWVAVTDHRALVSASAAVKRAFGREPVYVREGGSIPIVATFKKLLRVPVVLMGLGLPDDGLHAPN
ncbi:MAG TPA: dipeptidase, partial [Candidatus Polarisedimenticolaceae bacterium]|nr:dipeptidase [Candidatus Polarisedimenticolaceae bacterium]